MIVIDMHLDLAMNALNWNRDLRKSVHEIRQDEAGMTQKGRAGGTVAFPDMRAGDLAVCSATLLARENPRIRTGGIDFSAPQMAYGFAMGCLAYYRQLEAEGICRIITDWPRLERQVQEWETKGRDRTTLGKPMLQAMEAVGMILDVTHLADDSFFQALDIFHGTILASHNNCRALVPGDRQFTDDQIRLIVERGGVIGAAFDNWMLYRGYVKSETPRELVPIDNVVDHIDHVCQIAGNTRHAAIGTD